MGPMTAGATSVLTEGLLLGDYEILGVAGIGGMGVVYRAKQRSLDRIVALKVIRDEIAGLPEYRERFLREARLAASINHPHVVTVFDVGEYEQRLLLAMQWIDGEDLRSVLEGGGRLPPERAVRIVSQLAGALDAVHSVAGLVHRDVKPSNVLIKSFAGDDHAYLTDFGVARPTTSTGHLTQTGWVVGTAGYLSPEQIRGAEPGPRSDLYALGCLLFEALTGRPPFAGDNEMALRWAHANDPRPLPSSVVPALGDSFDGFISVALAISPEQRFASGRDFGTALAVAVGQHATATGAPIQPPHEPTVVGPSTPLPPAALETPQPAMYQGHGYATPPPAHPQSSRGGSPLALVLLAVVALAGIAAAVLVAAGVFNHGSPKTASSATHVNSTRRAAAHTRPSAGGKAHVQPENQTPPSTATSGSPAPSQYVTPSGNPVPGSWNTSAATYASGVGTPYHWSSGQACYQTVFAGTNTSCPFANNVFMVIAAARHYDDLVPGSITAYSPVTNATYALTCTEYQGRDNQDDVQCITSNGTGAAFPVWAANAYYK